MRVICLAAGRHLVGCCLLAGMAVWVASPARAVDTFPYDRELVLDARPMGPVKRMPVLTVGEDGRATVDLWCRTVAARVQVQDSAIKIETAPLPDALPQYMSDGQCSEQRVAADNEMLLALAQVTEWRQQGAVLTLSGLRTLKFRASDH
jgi:heat shock protein HslJ